MSNEKTCKNCKYFIKHYLRDEFGRYKLIDGAGHCKNFDIPSNSRKRITRTGAPCDFFQPEKPNPQVQKQTALEKLRHAELLIRDVKLILKGDKA